MLQLSSLKGADQIRLFSAHPLEDCVAKMKINRQRMYIFPCSEVSLSVAKPLSVSEEPSKETGPFSGILEAAYPKGWQRGGVVASPRDPGQTLGRRGGKPTVTVGSVTASPAC